MRNAGRGDWIRTSDLHTPSVMRYQAALRPDWLAHLGSPTNLGKVRREGGWRGGGEKANPASGLGGCLTALLALPALYFSAALIGSLVPVNRGWTEPGRGTTVYIADNGIHADIIMPVNADGLDWSRCPPESDFAAAPATRAGSRSAPASSASTSTRLAGGTSGRGTIWSALAGGKRVVHVEYVSDPSYSVRQMRLRPEEYRRLWAAIRADFELDSRAGRNGSTIRVTGRSTRSTGPVARPTRSEPAMPSRPAGLGSPV